MSALKPRLGDRALFPDLEVAAYLSHAAISPASTPVQEAVRRVTEDYARLGVDAFTLHLPTRDRLRQRLARLVGARPEDLALVPNTTTGVLDVALCFPWRAGDRIVTFEGEFPANVIPWQQAAEHYSLEVERLPLPRVPEPDAVAPLEAALRRGARLVAVSAVQFQTGFRMPLEEIGRLCRTHGAALFVDAIQAAGVVPLDVVALGIDFLACGSHKWLMGLEGAGFLYVAPHQLAALRPVVAGWLSPEGALDLLDGSPGRLRYDRPFRARADFLEPGTGNTAGYSALEASTALLEDLGVEQIRGHVDHYLDALEAGLLEQGFTSLRASRPEGRSGILAALPPRGASVPALARGLRARGISCSTPDGLLRFAPHWPNGLDEVPLVLRAVEEVLEAPG